MENSLCECQQANIILWVRPDLGHAHEVNSVFLGVEARRKVVPVSLIVAVVETKILQVNFCAESRFVFGLTSPRAQL